MIKPQSPKSFWDHCGELEACIRYFLNDEVPETMMKWHTMDISTICEYEQYEWVIYNDTTWKLPYSKFRLGQYLVPAIDLGYAMTAKILSKTVKVVPQYTICLLTMEETENLDLKEHCCKFYESVIAKIGEPTTETYFTDKGLTPAYDEYIDDITQGTPDAPDKDLQPTP